MVTKTTTIAIDNTYVQLFEQLHVTIDEALHHYAVQRVQHNLLNTEKRVNVWERKYGCSYDLFAYRTATDMAFVEALEREPDTVDWEGDLIVWEVDAMELNKWRNHLQMLSTG